MVQQYTRYGVTPTVDLVKQNISQLNHEHSLKRPLDSVASPSDVPIVGAFTSNPSVPTPFKRPCLESHEGDRIQASEIYSSPSTEGPAVSEYSQRRAVASTPTPTRNPLLHLSHPRYNLPETLVKNFASLGINSIYPWQSSCLLGRGILAGEQNLVYSAPTGGGKSLIGDVRMLKRVIEDPTKKAILVLPYVALVQEKLQWLRKAVDGVAKHVDLDRSSQVSPSEHKWRKPYHQSSVRVAGFYGGSKAFRAANWKDVDIAVCTFEKVSASNARKTKIVLNVLQANYLVNHAIEQCTIDSLGAVVLDELHMVDDFHRGYLMELLATKLLSLQCNVQIIGMSATLSVRVTDFWGRHPR